MLIHCKITKFWEVNYKILSCILATPVVISAVHKNPVLAKCYWCGECANIDYILLHCHYTKTIHNFVSQHLGEVSLESWILGGAGKAFDPVIWVVNFTMYKAHLQACHGQYHQPLFVFKQEACRFVSLFPALAEFVPSN